MSYGWEGSRGSGVALARGVMDLSGLSADRLKAEEREMNTTLVSSINTENVFESSRIFMITKHGDNDEICCRSRHLPCRRGPPIV